jgi:hypothetical protein
MKRQKSEDLKQNSSNINKMQESANPQTQAAVRKTRLLAGS